MEALGPILVKLVRGAIAGRLGLPAPPLSPAERARPELAETGASFVTLTIGGELRGCIGTLKAFRPLGEDVAAHGRDAAFEDPRFDPLTAAEYPRIHVEVSVLGEPRDLPVADEADACRKLRPGIDGVILGRGAKQATFLPQVWDELPEPREFLRHLKRKAGLPGELWDDKVTLRVYPVEKYAEPAAE